jgi:hypothetical protein
MAKFYTDKRDYLLFLKGNRLILAANRLDEASIEDGAGAFRPPSHILRARLDYDPKGKIPLAAGA